jgi:hypothetical protein
MRRLSASIAHADVVLPGPQLVETCARFRVECEAAGHPLTQRHHDTDRWIAATSVRLAVPLASHDAVFRNAPCHIVETMLS